MLTVGTGGWAGMLGGGMLGAGMLGGGGESLSCSGTGDLVSAASSHSTPTHLAQHTTSYISTLASSHLNTIDYN